MLKITLNEDDYLEFMLFNADHSPHIQKKWRRSMWIYMLVFLLLSVFFYFKNDSILSLYFVAVTIIFAFIHKPYTKWRYKRHYLNHIRNNLADRMGRQSSFELTETHLHTEDNKAESNVKIAEINEVIETIKFFFVKLGTGVGFIIPKREIDNPDELRSDFRQKGLRVSDFSDWKW